MGITFKVLIIDDEVHEQDLKQYKTIFGKIKADQNIDYDIEFKNVTTYQEAIPLFKSLRSEDIFDVILVDYNLETAGSEHDGKTLVEEVRSSINRHCKIIFYSMQELDVLFPKREDLVAFFNTGIFKFLPKDNKTSSSKQYGSPPHQLRVEVIIEAINDIDIVQIALQRYFADYMSVIENDTINIEGKNYTIPDIINAIRNDKEEGKLYKYNLAKTAILQGFLSAGEQK